MPKQELYHIRPLGWENDDEDERIPLSLLDYMTACTWNNYVLFFRLDDADKSYMVDVLKNGLERTLSQARHLCGTIEKDAHGWHSFLKRRHSAVDFHVQWLDAAEDRFPTFDELESRNFSSQALGNLRLWSVPEMMHGIKPEAHVDRKPKVAAFKANFVRGGLVFNMHHHHCANDVMGWASFTHQLAENCYAIVKNATFPTWNPSCLDRSRFIRKEVPEEAKTDAPPARENHPDLRPIDLLLFRLPLSKAARLKKMAMPKDGSWISTYDAFSAFIWRTFSRLRVPVFKPDMSSPLSWGEAVDMRRRVNSPPCPPRTQGNIMSGVMSAMSKGPLRQPTTAEVISDSSLSELALFIRQLTNGVTQEDLDKRLDMVATFRDKTNLFFRTDVVSPMSIFMTDWRATDIAAADFGLAKPVAFRHHSEMVTRCIVQVYPPRAGTDGSEDRYDFAVTYEKDLAKDLIEDPEWSAYFEYRGLV
ncbi:transferase family-domain-containing protein [Truncatella angustata]|uniref:Transferase family-domain-containing protein n=1 Tax=Truncatella angustata TaxID=152316 RepID=A0A9P8US86_9PEZI|nr:transferase family-domain-containing protein [Truncatella angustata]KAH6658090.1 transferase family-domain-containing protein [Truncatella angustata]